jgi:membrane-bound ClpP family serine protease
MSPVAWAFFLLLLGVIFIVLEIFLPSGGALGVMAALSFLAAIVVGFLTDRSGWTGGTILLAVCVIVPTAIGIAIRWWPHTPIGRSMLILPPRSSDEVLPETTAYRGLKELIGRHGHTKGLMLPSGTVVIDDKTYDAVSEGMPIEANETVVVVGVSTQRLVVRPGQAIPAELADAAPAGSAAADPNQPLIDDIPDPFAE